MNTSEKYLQICSQRERELAFCKKALVEARKSLYERENKELESDAKLSVNNALGYIFNL